jgi:hypothetical protein
MTTQRKGRRALTLAVRAPPLAKLLHHVLGHDRILHIPSTDAHELPSRSSLLKMRRYLAVEVQRKSPSASVAREALMCLE